MVFLARCRLPRGPRAVFVWRSSRFLFASPKWRTRVGRVLAAQHIVSESPASVRTYDTKLRRVHGMSAALAEIVPTGYWILTSGSCSATKTTRQRMQGFKHSAARTSQLICGQCWGCRVHLLAKFWLFGIIPKCTVRLSSRGPRVVARRARGVSL